MITFLPAIIAASAYLIWQSNRSSYDHHLIEQCQRHMAQLSRTMANY